MLTAHGLTRGLTSSSTNLVEADLRFNLHNPDRNMDRTLVGTNRVGILLAEQRWAAAGAEKDPRRQDVGNQHRRSGAH